jgi:hypothetical protein
LVLVHIDIASISSWWGIEFIAAFTLGRITIVLLSNYYPSTAAGFIYVLALPVLSWQFFCSFCNGTLIVLDGTHLRSLGKQTECAIISPVHTVLLFSSINAPTYSVYNVTTGKGDSGSAYATQGPKTLTQKINVVCWIL